jgi:formylglycine-generating enzyme required for sulfatase activity
MANVFISYARERTTEAEYIARLLELYGYTTWKDEKLVSGEDFPDQLTQQIRNSNAVLVIWCKDAVLSHWVREEATLARHLGKLVPIVIEPCELPLGDKTLHYTNLIDWDGSPASPSFAELLQQIAVKAGREPGIPGPLDSKFAIWTWSGIRAASRPQANSGGLGVGKPQAFTDADDVFQRQPGKETATGQQEPTRSRQRATNVVDGRPRGRRFLYWSASIAVLVLAVLFFGFTPKFFGNAPVPLTPSSVTPEPVLLCEGDKIRVETGQGAACLASHGATFKDCPYCPEMLTVRSGSIVLKVGAKETVGFAAPFAAGKYEVSFAEWEACLRTPGFCTGDPTLAGEVSAPPGLRRSRLPVVGVSWKEIGRQFIPWLNHQLTQAGVTKQRYRLLTEAEWEYIATAGTTSDYWWGDEPDIKLANFDPGRGQEDTYRKRLVEIDELAPNPWGFYHILGNAAELTANCYESDKPSIAALTTPASECNFYVWRGGSFWHNSQQARLDYRRKVPGDEASTRIGFRVMRTIN